MEDYIAVISSVGFPIFIAMFILIRMENKIEKLISAFIELSESITKIIEKTEKNETNEELVMLIRELNKHLGEGKKPET